MSLSCDCDVGDYAWFYIPRDEYAPLTTKRSRKCCSCGEKIKVGGMSLSFERHRPPNNDIEESIYGYGGEVPLASWYMCESCGDMYLNLSELGFCFQINENMFDLLEQYKDLNGGKHV